MGVSAFPTDSVDHVTAMGISVVTSYKGPYLDAVRRVGYVGQYRDVGPTNEAPTTGGNLGSPSTARPANTGATRQ